MRRLVILAALVAVVACSGALEASAALASGGGSDAPWADPFGNVGPAVAVPTGYWVDVDESGTTTSGSLGGSGSLSATGTGNVNYGFDEECAPGETSGGPFSIGFYPPLVCSHDPRHELGRPFASPPNGFWFTGNEHCVSAGRSLSGTTFTWHVQLPQTGPWHVEVHIPSWTSYGWGNQYILTAADGRFENTGFIQQAYNGQWVQLFGSHQFNTGQDYTVELTPSDTSDSNCHYQMADQMRWVYDGTEENGTHKGSGEAVPSNSSPPLIFGAAVEGQTLAEANGVWANSPISYTYQWEDCNSSGGQCVPIPGATSQSYALTASDVEHTIVVKETATNEAGVSSPSTSVPTAVVTAASVLNLPQPGVNIPPTACSSSAQAASMRPPRGKVAIANIAARGEDAIARLTPARAVSRTVSRRARQFDIAVTLSKGLARLFDPHQECPQTLQGSGYVNFRERAARWTVTLPGVFQGELQVIAIRNRTYVNAPEFARGKAHKAVWIELRSTSDYKTFDKLPLLRDIVVLTNPLRSLDVLRSVKAGGNKRAHRAVNRHATAPQARVADSPSISASCSQQAQSVADGTSVDAKHLTDQFSLNTKVDETTLKSWAESKISAEADNSGVCQETISVENAKAEGFDVVFDFTSSSPKDPSIQAPQSTATAEWKVIYHVKDAPCLDGTWDGEESVSAPNPGGGEITGTLTGHLAIAASGLSWSYTFTSMDEYEITVGVDPEPPYTPIYGPDSFTGNEGFKGSGAVTGALAAMDGNLSAFPSGVWSRTFSPDLRGLSPGLNAGGNVTLSLDIAFNCSARQLTVDAYVPGGEKLIWGFDMHKMSDAPPQVTVEQNWRSEISAPVPSGSS